MYTNSPVPLPSVPLAASWDEEASMMSVNRRSQYTTSGDNGADEVAAGEVHSVVAAGGGAEHANRPESIIAPYFIRMMSLLNTCVRVITATMY
jgi:hypothetical protein